MRVSRTRLTSGLLGMVLLTSTAACGTAQPEAGASAPPPPAIRLYGANGNMSNSFAAALSDHPGVLGGMTGTAPLTPLGEDFKRRVRTVDPALLDDTYAGESYDAVVIAALAAEYARTADPPTVAGDIVGVTTGGEMCETVSTCLSLARAGRDLRYRGIALRESGLTDTGEPSSATYGALSFGHDNTIETSRTQYIGAGDPAAASRNSPPPPGRKVRNPPALKIGALLPHTGRLASAGPPMFAGARLAIQDLNQAGGVLGQPVGWVDGDDGTSDNVAAATVDRLIRQGVAVIIGASSSSVTAAVLPAVVAAHRVLISPSATGDELGAMDDAGLFFRTSPPDALQAKALADVIMRDGPTRIAIVATDDRYGLGLQQAVEAELATAGVRRSEIKLLKYPAKDAYQQAADFGPAARDIKDFAPDGLLIVGFDESALLIKELLSRQVRIRQ
jgi:ABC-type branched-subunit amino acid transport system substrate-binding protein